MRKRLFAILAVIAGTLIAGVVVQNVFLRRPRLNHAIMERVTVGMSRAEVEKILGGPPGDYTTDGMVQSAGGFQFSYKDCWECDDGALFVFFDKDDKAEDVHLVAYPTWFSRVRTRLGF